MHASPVDIDGGVLFDAAHLDLELGVDDAVTEVLGLVIALALHQDRLHHAAILGNGHVFCAVRPDADITGGKATDRNDQHGHQKDRTEFRVCGGEWR